MFNSYKSSLLNGKVAGLYGAKALQLYFQRNIGNLNDICSFGTKLNSQSIYFVDRWICVVFTTMCSKVSYVKLFL
jgi:hypothetical protein